MSAKLVAREHLAASCQDALLRPGVALQVRQSSTMQKSHDAAVIPGRHSVASSWGVVPSLSFPVSGEKIPRHEQLEMIPNGAVRKSKLLCQRSCRRAPMTPDGGDDALLDTRELQHWPLDVHLRFKRPLLRAQRSKEEHGPCAERRGIVAHGELGFAGRSVVPQLVFLDNAFVGRVRHVLVCGAKHQQCRERARQPAISILEWMDRQKLHDESGNDDQGGIARSSDAAFVSSTSSVMRRGVSNGAAV